MERAMFCRQCEQAAQGVGCEVMGNCGKNPEVAALLDLMIHGLKGIAVYAHRARELGAKDREVDTVHARRSFHPGDQCQL